MPALMITARMIVAELERRGISVVASVPERISLLSFDYAGKPRMIIGCTPDFSSAITIPVCRSKIMTHWLLSRDTDIPLPESAVYENDSAAEEFLGRHGVIVVKPQDGAHGNGVTVGVRDMMALKVAVAVALEQSMTGIVILQQMVKGKDVRLLVIDNIVVAATYRIPAHVSGDGVASVRQLIEKENQTNPNRGVIAYDKRLNQIDIVAAERFLGEDINRIPALGEEVTVVGAANIGSGGESHECMAELPVKLMEHAVAACRAIRTFVCGVDFMYDPQSGEYCLIELNSSPSFGLHLWPSVGNPTDIAPLYVDALLAQYDRDATVA